MVDSDSCTCPVTHHHPAYEGGDVGGGVACVSHSSEVVEVGSSTVPVHHQDIHVSLLYQQPCDVVDPDGGRASGPVAVDDEGGRSGDVEQQHFGEVVMRKLVATVQVGTCVQEQTHVQVGSNERLMEVHIRKVVTLFAFAWLESTH